MWAHRRPVFRPAGKGLFNVGSRHEKSAAPARGCLRHRPVRGMEIAAAAVSVQVAQQAWPKRFVTALAACGCASGNGQLAQRLAAPTPRRVGGFFEALPRAMMRERGFVRSRVSGGLCPVQGGAAHRQSSLRRRPDGAPEGLCRTEARAAGIPGQAQRPARAMQQIRTLRKQSNGNASRYGSRAPIGAAGLFFCAPRAGGRFHARLYPGGTDPIRTRRQPRFRPHSRAWRKASCRAACRAPSPTAPRPGE